ncbi:hypothetical protein PRIPAC_98055 [Pristionchus pacificus]|uniref:G protein-coupled receptor n=1 Tax=Pristionchus pacificus TaxID=54126 RepID=A0A2A6D2I5_PRIPA|nr:hypothetical protein PRIPAC_98055 [Pristionchus pacificus]|eukprot:PDM84609.1 G protein-coupled receptor [Pristionchus pacificus]
MAVQIRFITETLAAPEYDCSSRTPAEWTEQFGTKQYLLGPWSILFATVCQILYLPSLRVFHRERKSTCFKIMHFLAMADMCGLTCTGTLFGYAAINGMHFCSDVLLGTIMGAGAFCFWCVSTCTCALLVINRICELTERASYFQGWRSYLCMVIILVYSVVSTLWTRPVFPNSTHQTMAFYPFIPGHTPDEYPNLTNMIHNFCVSFFVPNLYFILCTIVRKKSQKFQDSNTTQALQAKIFMQASIICCGNVGTAAAIIQLAHPNVRLPCIIYLVLNRAVRDEFWKMLGRKPKIAMNGAHPRRVGTEQFGRRQDILGPWSIVFATVCQPGYARLDPAGGKQPTAAMSPGCHSLLRVLRATPGCDSAKRVLRARGPSWHRHSRKAHHVPAVASRFSSRAQSLKIMHFLAMADMCGLTCTGTLFGYAAFNGMHFCSDVLLGEIMGAGAFCFWCVSKCTCAFLVINRICELIERASYFQDFCMLIILVYSVVSALWTRPVFPNSHHTMAFYPYIPGHTPDEHVHMPMIAISKVRFRVSFFVLNLYFVLCIIVRKKSKKFQVSNTTQALQAKIFMQASIICCENVGTAAA